MAGPNPHGTPDTSGTLTPAESFLAAGTTARVRSKDGADAMSDQLVVTPGQRRSQEEAPSLLKSIQARLLKNIQAWPFGQHPSSAHTAEQNVHRAETPPSECLAAAGNRNKANPRLIADGRANSVPEARRQDFCQSPLTEAFEREQGLGKFIPVGSCGNDSQLGSAIDIDQRGRFLFGPEGLPAKLAHPLGTLAAQSRIFHAAADAINGNQNCNQFHPCRLQARHQAPQQMPIPSASPGCRGVPRHDIRVKPAPDAFSRQGTISSRRDVVQGFDHADSLKHFLFR
jgi:hypothetical protein